MRAWHVIAIAVSASGAAMVIVGLVGWIYQTECDRANCGTLGKLILEQAQLGVVVAIAAAGIALMINERRQES